MPRQKWTHTTKFAAIASSSIDAGDNKLGSEFNNGNLKKTVCSCQLTWTCAAGATAYEVFELYFLYSVDDGTTYEDGGDSVDPFKSPVHRFIDDGGTAAQIQAVVGLEIHPFPFKPLLKSELGADATLVVLDLWHYQKTSP
tara:strand:- start:12737 stop:13159 length:423 start_codon:yes stop_codon:yes gene_type:complete